jgi:hypothetical protein
MLACTKVEREAWLEQTAGVSDHQGLKKSWASLMAYQSAGKTEDIFMVVGTIIASHDGPSTSSTHCSFDGVWHLQSKGFLATFFA